MPATESPTPLTTPGIEICDDCIDDDGNGLVDHDDPQCTEPADGGGLGLDDPATAKAVVGCARAIRVAGGTLAVQEIAQMQRCLATVMTCVQAKPGDGACLAKAATACAKSSAAIATARNALPVALTKSCGAAPLDATTLLDTTGLGYEAEAATCARYGVPSVGTLDDVAACVASRHACAAERLVGFEYPRAAELLALGGLDPGVFPCLASGADGGGAGLPAPTGTLALKCAKTFARAGATFAKGRLTALRRCSASVFLCVQEKNGDETCLSKAEATCAAATAKLPALAAKLDASVAKSCGPEAIDPSALLAASGLGFDADAGACAARGVPSLATSVDAAACLRLQHQCETDQLLENEMPRLYELLQLIGAILP